MSDFERFKGVGGVDVVSRNFRMRRGEKGSGQSSGDEGGTHKFPRVSDCQENYKLVEIETCAYPFLLP
jgi:hypothetical protein